MISAAPSPLSSIPSTIGSTEGNQMERESNQKLF